MIFGRFKNSLKILGAVLVLSFAFSMQAPAESVNEIKFPEGLFAAKLKKIISDGPNILPAAEEFDVAPPPANDSAETQAALDQLMEWAETKRDEETLERIYFENSAGKAHNFFINEGLLIEEGNDKTIQLLNMIDDDHIYFVLKYKEKFMRARPDNLERDLTTAIPNPPHPAYPSGHASQSYMVALVLADFDPANAEKYKQFAVDVAHRREIAGVHYPDDSDAGRKLAVDVLERLLEEPVVRKKYEDARVSYVKPTT